MVLGIQEPLLSDQVLQQEEMRRSWLANSMNFILQTDSTNQMWAVIGPNCYGVTAFEGNWFQVP